MAKHTKEAKREFIIINKTFLSRRGYAYKRPSTMTSLGDRSIFASVGRT